MLLKIAPAVENLAHQRFARRQHRVRLEPHAALGLPPAFADPLLYLFKSLRGRLLDKCIQLRLGQHKAVLRIAVHQAQRRVHAADGLLAGLPQRPLPRHVDVRRARCVYRHRRRRPPLAVILFQGIRSRADALSLCLRSRIPQVKKRQRLIQCVQSLRLLRVAFIQKLRRLKDIDRVIIQARCVLIIVGERQPEKQVRSRFARICIEAGSVRVARFPVLCENQILMVHVKRRGHLSVHIAYNLRIVSIPDVRGPCVQRQAHLSARELLRDAHAGAEDEVPVRAAPGLIFRKWPERKALLIKCLAQVIPAVRDLHS